MRRLLFAALALLATLPLAAHEGWRREYRPRRVVIVEPGCRPFPRWELERRDRWERRHHHGRYDRYERYDDDCEGPVVYRPLPRPLDPPFGATVVLRVR